MQRISENDFYKKKYMTSVAYLVGVLLFLLPFVEIKCNNNTFAENSGIGLALGTDYKILEQIRIDPSGNDKATIKASKNNGKMYVIALISLILGIAGIIISLRNNYRLSAVNMMVGGLAAILLIALMIQLKYDINDQVKNKETDPAFVNAIQVTVNFTVWYYLSIASFLIAAFLSFKQRSLFSHKDIPPKNAPQVRIDNPGDQSEFPTYPDQSELER